MLIEMTGIGKVYSGEVPYRALQDVNLTIDRGEFIAIIGQSGSGKSTLLNLIGTLDRPSEGRFILDGKDVGQQSDRGLTLLRSTVVGFIFQFHYLLPDFTVLENVLMPRAAVSAAPTRQEVKEATELLERVGVGSQIKKYANQISGGQQQRVAIARALMGSKPLVLADEPTGNLDSVTGQECFELMREINLEKNTTFIIVTHDERIAQKCDRIIRITDGRIVEDALTGVVHA